MGPRVLLPPAKRPKHSTAHTLGQKGKPTKMSVTYKKKPDYPFPDRVSRTYTNHGINLSNPHLVSLLGRSSFASSKH